MDLLIQIGDEAMISHLHNLEKEKNRDITKNEKKRKTTEQKVDNNVPFTSDIDDNIDMRIFSNLTQNQLESFQLILKLLNTRQLKALQFASRYVLTDVYVFTVVYVLRDVYVLTVAYILFHNYSSLSIFISQLICNTSNKIENIYFSLMTKFDFLKFTVSRI